MCPHRTASHTLEQCHSHVTWCHCILCKSAVQDAQHSVLSRYLLFYNHGYHLYTTSQSYHLYTTSKSHHLYTTSQSIISTLLHNCITHIMDPTPFHTSYVTQSTPFRHWQSLNLNGIALMGSENIIWMTFVKKKRYNSNSDVLIYNSVLPQVYGQK